MKVNELINQANVINVDELGGVPELVADGLRAIVLCHHGIGRSCDAAQALTEIGYPSACLEDGLEGLSALEDSEKKKVLSLLAEAPYISAILAGEEIIKFEDVLREIADAKGADVQLAQDFCEIYRELRRK